MKQNAQNVLPKNASLLKRLEKLTPQTIIKKAILAKKPPLIKRHSFTCGSALTSNQV